MRVTGLGGLVFTLASGELGQQPTTYAAAQNSRNSAGGKYFFRSDYYAGRKAGDGPIGILRSTPFTLASGDITFQHSGAGGYIGVCKGDNDCKKFPQHPQTSPLGHI